jgi:hypothetical protein
MTEREILQALRDSQPFKGLSNVRVANLVEQPEAKLGRFDAKFDLQFGQASVEVYVEVKSACTPKQVEQIAPWLSQMKATKNGTAFALVCPVLSPQSQELCLERRVDFIDLSGNLFINVPGKLLLQRVGMESRQEISPSFYRNPFSGKSSRILRVLLQKPKVWTASETQPWNVPLMERAVLEKPKAWTLTEITEELAKETSRIECTGVSFEVSFSLASRVLRSLEEELLVMRRNSAVLVPEPRRLLSRWAQEYRDRNRWYLRRSFKLPNPFGPGLQSVRQGLDGLLKPKCYAFTGAAAASVTAPFIDLDPIDLYTSDEAGAQNLRALISGTSLGPDLRVIYPFDAGVFMYSSLSEGTPIVSDIQAYLDLFARGGRDLKQADYLLQNRIEPMWGNK